MDKRDVIKNPLTLIALFAGLSEVGMTTVLPFLAHENQGVFMWFVMVYPSVLVCMFFYVLVWKREALYAPSDFKDDATFLAVMRDNQRNILGKYPLEPAINASTDKSNNGINKLGDDSFLDNPFYTLLRTLGIKHEDVISLVQRATNVEDIPNLIKDKPSGKDMSEKIQRILSDFESSKYDFYMLKNKIDGGSK